MKKNSPLLDLKTTEKAIKFVKETFEQQFAKQLNLLRVSAPLILFNHTGLNDDLNGVEQPIVFDICQKTHSVTIVQSLAKWKRFALKKYQFHVHQGLYTDMNAIRKDETLDALHSIYVDQWDWEKIITPQERNLPYLKKVVNKIYQALLQTQKKVKQMYPQLQTFLPPTLHFITTQELENHYPSYTAKERELAICKEYQAVFLMQIGHPLNHSKKPHDNRAPDYDDWKLNGDLLVYSPLLDCVIELSSMGIRVDKETLNQLPFTIGGGIGQSRLCMLLLNKKHIGEVQVSVWPKTIIEQCKQEGIDLL